MPKHEMENDETNLEDQKLHGKRKRLKVLTDDKVLIEIKPVKDVSSHQTNGCIATQNVDTVDVTTHVDQDKAVKCKVDLLKPDDTNTDWENVYKSCWVKFCHNKTNESYPNLVFFDNEENEIFKVKLNSFMDTFKKHEDCFIMWRCGIGEQQYAMIFEQKEDCVEIWTKMSDTQKILLLEQDPFIQQMYRPVSEYGAVDSDDEFDYEEREEDLISLSSADSGCVWECWTNPEPKEDHE